MNTYPFPHETRLPPLLAGEGWGGVRAQRASQSQTSRQSYFIFRFSSSLTDTVAFFSALKHRQPHPNPPLLSQGREPTSARSRRRAEP
jgi:hypothetical protein